MKDAAKTCTQLAKYDYKSRGCGALLYYKRLYSRRIDPRRAFFDKLIAAVENPESLGLNIKALVTASGLKPGDMPAPAMARRLRVITSTIAPLLPEKSRGIAADKNSFVETALVRRERSIGTEHCQDVWRDVTEIRFGDYGIGRMSLSSPSSNHS